MRPEAVHLAGRLAVARWPTASTPAELLEFAMALKREASERTAD
jgi:hypothetical protein